VPLYPAISPRSACSARTSATISFRTFYADLGGAISGSSNGRRGDGGRISLRTGEQERRGAQDPSGSALLSARSSRSPSLFTEREIRAEDRRAIRTAFDRLYDQRYAPPLSGGAGRIVNIRLAVIGKRATLKFPRLAARSAVSHFERCRCIWAIRPVRILSGIPARRARGGRAHRGPALVR